MQRSDEIRTLEVQVSMAGVAGWIELDPPPADKPPAVGPLRVYPEDDQPQHAKV